MQRVTSFARGSAVPAATLNALQDRAVGLTRATGAVPGALALAGRDGRYWSSPDGGVPDGAIALLDASRDWRGHHLRATFVRLTAADQRLHGAAAWQRNDPAQSIAVRTIDDAWTGANPTAIVPGLAPVPGAGVCVVVLDELAAGVGRVYLYARSSDGALCLYNDAGATLHAELFFDGASASASAGGRATVPGFLHGDLVTTDATWATVVTATLAPSSTVTFVGAVSAIRDDGTESGAWTFSARARRPASGLPVMGGVLFALVDHDGTGWDVRFEAIGADVGVQVRGEVARRLLWRAELQTTEASGR